MTTLRNFIILAAIFLSVGSAAAQSTDQAFPSPVTTNEVAARIRPRDIGDSRSTSHFYAFDGDQGDIFINVVTKNLEGNIDVFTASGLRPLAKITVYGDSTASETGRLIYLRQRERLLLRVEGRTPNDDPAEYRIKFAGSFVALSASPADEAPRLPTVGKEREDSGIRVNSVGTIVEVIPKAVPVKPAEVRAAVSEKGKASTPPAVDKPKAPATKVADENSRNDNKRGKTKEVSEKDAKAPDSRSKLPAVKPSETAAKKDKKLPERPVEKSKKPAVADQPASTEKVKKPDPMAGIRLVIELKDGTSVWRPMTEVLKFSVDQGVLTVIGKDGRITRYQITDVARINMQ